MASPITLQQDGLHIASDQILIQRQSLSFFGALLGRTITVSMLLADGRFATNTAILPPTLQDSDAVYITADVAPNVSFSLMLLMVYSGYQVGRIINTSGQDIVVKAVKTEVSDHQTLAHQDSGGNWVLNDPPPKFGAELAECQRYQIEIFNKVHTGQGYLIQAKSTTTASAYGILSLPVTMRDGAPTLLTDCSPATPYKAAGVFANGYDIKDVTSISVYTFTENNVGLKLVCPEFVMGNDYLIFVSNQNTHTFLLDRNL